MSELVRHIDDAIAAGQVRMVFWTCPYPTHRRVDWLRLADGRAIPRCDHCGRMGDPR